MKTTRLSLLLVIVLLSIVMLGRTQESATSASTIVARPYETAAGLQKYRKIRAVPLPDPRNLFRGSPAADKSLLWRMHLALQLVKRPGLNQRQVRVILDAISLATPGFFAARTAEEKTKADDALQSLARRAVSAFPNNQVTELFANIADAKDEEDILKMYYDLSALPLSTRKALYTNASPNDKSDLWRTHLALFLVKRPNLNQWQQQVILAAMSLVTPEYFGVRSSDPAWKTKVREPVRSFEEQMVDAFPLEDAAKIFGTLGDDSDGANSSASVLLKSINYKPLSDSGPYKQWTHKSLAAQDFQRGQTTCQCSTDSDYCPISGYCRSTNCTPTGDGCGTFWSYPCNGTCR